MQESTPSKKMCLFLDSDSDEQNDEQKKNIEQKEQQNIKFQKVYAFEPPKAKFTKQDKFTINRFEKNMFINETDTMEFDNFLVKEKIQIPKQKDKQKRKYKNNQNQRPNSLSYIPTSQQIEKISNEGNENKKMINRKQIQQIEEKSSESPQLLKLKSQTLIPRNNKMFHLDFSSSSSEDEQNKKNSDSLQKKVQLEQNDTELNRKKINEKYQKQIQTNQQQQKNKNNSKSSQQEQEEQQQSGPSQEIAQLNDFVFNQETQLVVLNKISPQQRLRAYISRSRSGFNMLWPEYSIRLQKQNKQFLYVKKASFSLTSCYQMYVRAQNGQQKYFGKLISEFSNNNFKIYISEDGSHEQLRGEIIFPSSNGGRQPRFFIMYYLIQGYKLNDLTWLDWKQTGNQKTLKNLYKYDQNKDKIKVFQTKKPTFNAQIKGFVLNFGGRINIPSIKNFILEEAQTGKQVLMFGKINKDNFRLQTSHPLNCVVGTAIAMIQFQYGLSD